MKPQQTAGEDRHRGGHLLAGGTTSPRPWAETEPSLSLLCHADPWAGSSPQKTEPLGSSVLGACLAVTQGAVSLSPMWGGGVTAPMWGGGRGQRRGSIRTEATCRCAPRQVISSFPRERENWPEKHAVEMPGVLP